MDDVSDVYSCSIPGSISVSRLKAKAWLLQLCSLFRPATEANEHE